MKAYRVELGDTDEIQERFANDIKEIREAALADYSNLSGSAKGKFTLANNNQNRIRSNAQDLYNNSDVGKAEQNLSNIDNLQDTINKKTEEYNDLIKQSTEEQEQLANKTKESTETTISGLKAERDEGQKYVELQNNIKNGFESIGRGAKQIVSVTTAWRSLRNVLKSTFNDIKSLDKAFGSIAMVTSYSVKDLWQQYDQYAAMANRLGQSTQSVIEASGLYYQQGLKTNEVLQLTEETMKLATLAGLDFKEATSQMTAALRAFHMDMSEGAHVTDVYAEVAAHAAVDVQGLSEAMSATAAIANSAGMSFEKTTAMLATMVEATQEAPKNLGTAMKTILARFTELKTNVAGTVDSEFDDLDYNKVDKALKSVGVNIKDATGQFRDMDEVLLELSSKWNGLDRNSQRYIATIAAGSRQQSRFIALMENYERTMELVNVAQNSAGRSSQQFAKYQDTVEYKVNKLKNTWEQFRTNMLTSDFYKDSLDNFSNFLNKLNEMSVGGLATLGATWLTVGRKAIGGAVNSYSGLISDIVGSRTGGGLTSRLVQGRFNSHNKKMNEALEAGNETVANEELEKSVKWENIAQNKDKLKKVGSSIGNILATGITTAITIGLTEDDPIAAGLESAAASALTLGPTFIQLGMQLGGPIGAGIGAAVTAAITLASTGISWIRSLIAEEEKKAAEYRSKYYKEQIEENNKIIDQKRSSIKANEEESKSLKSIQDDYNELKNKVYKTQKEQERYDNLIKTLQTDYPELISYYNEETGQLELQNELLQEKIDKNNKLQEQEKQNVAAKQVENINNQKELDKADDELSFKDKLRQSGYKSRDIKKTDERGYIIETYSGLDESDVLKRIEESDYGIENLDKEFEKEIQQGTITIDELRQIKKIAQETLKANHDYSGQYLALAKENINNDINQQNLSQAEKNATAIVQASLMERRDNSLQALIESEELTGERDNLKTELQRLKDYLPKNGKFNFDVDKMQDAILDIQEGWNTEDDWEDLKDTTKKQLEKLGITTEEEYKKLVNNGAMEEEELQKKIYSLIASQAVAGVKLTEKGQKSINDLVADTQAVLNSNMTLDEKLKAQQDLIEKNRNKYKSEEIINQSFEPLTNYSNAINRFGLGDNRYLQTLSPELMAQMQTNLGKMFDELKPLGEEKAKDLMKTFYNSLSDINLTGQAKDAILNFDFSTLKDKNKDEIQKILVDMITDDAKTGHVAEEEGKKIVEKIMQGMQDANLANFSILSGEALKEQINKISEQKTTIVKTYQDLMKDISSDLGENGYIDFLNIDKIKEQISSLDLDPNDFLNVNKQGNYIVDYERLNEAIKGQLGTEEELTKELEEQKQQGLAQLDLEIAQIDALIEGQDWNEKKTTELAKQTKLLAEQASLIGAIENRSELTTSNLVNNIVGREITSSSQLSSSEKEALKKQRDELQKARDELAAVDVEGEAEKQLRAAEQKALAIEKNFYENLKDSEEKLNESRKQAQQDYLDKQQAIIDAQKALSKAIENVTEKQKELKAVIEGTNWKSSIDGMYNYTTAMDYWVKETERAKKKLEKAGSITEAKNNYQLYGEGLLKQKSQLTAQNKVYQTAYNNFGNILKNDLDRFIKDLPESEKISYNIEDFITLDKTTGQYQVNTNATNRPGKINEYIRKWFEDNGPKANEYFNKIKENNDKIEQLDEEFLEQQKKARDEYIDLQDQMIEVLREKYQKEIDDLQNKYDAMNEADNKYLESLQKNLEKQRKLRDQEKNWNDLTNKERKLSLMQRDTSGGNLADVKNLQEEIDDQRTQLLDDAVDQIIEKLTEFYELQREARDAEIEYKQTLIDDVSLLKEATEALEKIQTSDDLVNWWKKNVTDIEGFSKEKLEKVTQDWNELFDAKSQYVASIDETMLQSITDTNGHLKDVSDEAVNIVETTSEGITQLAEQSLQEAGEEYKKAVKAAKDALADAYDAVQKQKQALDKAIQAAEASKKAFEKITEKYNEVLAQKEMNKTQVIYVNGKAYTNQIAANRASVEAAQTGKDATQTKGTVDKGSQDHRDAISRSKSPNSSDFGSPGWGVKSTERYVGENSNGEITLYSNKNAFSHYNPYKNKGETEKIREDIKHGILWYDPSKKKWMLEKGFTGDETLEDAKKWMNDNTNYYYDDRGIKTKKQYRAFAEGGLVNYTGPAWVDGSRSKPEAFLSSEDTRRIGEAARILADLPILSQPIKEQVPTTTIGDTTIQIDVHVDSIANDYDLDEAMNKVEQRIVNAAKYAGSNVILKKH